MTKIVLTYEDFVSLPYDGKRYELHEGELSVTPAPGTRHQQVLLNLALVLVGEGRMRHGDADYSSRASSQWLRYASGQRITTSPQMAEPNADDSSAY